MLMRAAVITRAQNSSSAVKAARVCVLIATGYYGHRFFTRVCARLLGVYTFRLLQSVRV
jgi:hypothetical protein